MNYLNSNIALHLVHVGLIILIMAKTFEEEFEELKDQVSQHEEILGNIVWVLYHEETLPEETRESIKESMAILYGKQYK